jgi:rhodanese-related sulfurtransferase
MFGSAPSTPEIDAREAIALVDAGGTMIDVREQHEWDAGHAPGATLLPMSSLESRVGEVPTDQRVLVMCRSGSRSARVTDALLAAGYDAVNVAGGMLAWRDAGGEVVADGDQPARV